jgi:hypothetical protein
VRPEALDLRRPQFASDCPWRIILPEYYELAYVCKWLRAYKGDKFLPGPKFDVDFNVRTRILKKMLLIDNKPSRVPIRDCQGKGLFLARLNLVRGAADKWLMRCLTTSLG